MTDPAVPAVSSPASDSPCTPPVAEQRPLERTFHGDTFVDRYEWLRDKDDARVIAHLEAENAYTEGQTAHLEPLRERIFTEIKDRTQETDLSVPVREGDWWYYARTVEGSQYAIRCRRPVAGPDDWTPPAIEPAADGAAIEGEQILLDSNAEADGHAFFSLGAFEVSPDGSLLAYSTDTEGDERFTLKIRDLATGEDLADEIPGTSHGATFSAHGDHLFYVTVDDAWRPDTVWRHRVGSPASQDVKVFTEPDESYFVGFGMTRSRQYLTIYVGSKITTEVLLLDAGDPTGTFRSVWPRRHGVEYDVDHAVIDGSDRLLILHNDGATNFELIDVPADDPTSTTDRQVVIPHDDEVRLEDASAFADHLVISYRREGLTRVGVIPFDRVLDGEQLHEIAFDEPIYTVGAAGNPEFAQPTVRLGYTSLATPATTYDYVLATRELRLLKQQPVRGGYDPDDYVQTASGPPRRTARRSRCPWSTSAASCTRARPRRCCCTATARTRRASTRRSPSPGCRCSTGVWPSSSRTCAAAARWAGAGTTRARRSRRGTPSPTSSRPPTTSSRGGGRARRSSSPRAAAPAGC
ncbi:Protease 2 [Clavibacter michiganensis subsp. michiganensis]|nr:Protease 2 [Clavibacter michiganensis subsp. michiganensis]